MGGCAGRSAASVEAWDECVSAADDTAEGSGVRRLDASGGGAGSAAAAAPSVSEREKMKVRLAWLDIAAVSKRGVWT